MIQQVMEFRVVSTPTLLAAVRSLHRNYRCKSLATQIPQDARLTSTPYTGQKFLSQYHILL